MNLLRWGIFIFMILIIDVFPRCMCKPVLHMYIVHSYRAGSPAAAGDPALYECTLYEALVYTCSKGKRQ